MDSLINKVKELLFGLQTAKSQKPIVAEVEDYGRQKRGSYAKTLPDLLVRWADVNPFAKVVSEQLGEFSLSTGNLSVLDFRTGDHNNDARVFVNQAFLDQLDLPRELPYTELRNYVERMVIDSPR